MAEPTDDFGVFITPEQSLEAFRRGEIERVGPWADAVRNKEPLLEEVPEEDLPPLEYTSVLNQTLDEAIEPVIPAIQDEAPAPLEPAKYERVRSLPEEEDKLLLQRQEEYVQGLSGAGWEDLSLEKLYERVQAGLEDRAPKRSYAPGKGSHWTTKPVQALGEYSGWLPSLAYLRDTGADEGNYPATSLPYYGQRRGFGRLQAWARDREGFTGVREGEEQAEEVEGLEGAASARELIGEAEGKIIETGKRAGFADFEPLLITPSALKVLRLDLQRMSIPEDQANAIPLEYVAPLWLRMRKQIGEAQQAVAVAEEQPTSQLKGSARVLGEKELEDITVQVPLGADQREDYQAHLATKGAQSAEDALKNVQIKEGERDLYAAVADYEAQAKDIRGYSDLARVLKYHPDTSFQLKDALTKQEIKVPLIYLKDKGWNIDVNKVHEAVTYRKYKELWRVKMSEMEAEGLTPEAARQVIYKDEVVQQEMKEKAVRHASRRVATIVSHRGRLSTPAWFTTRPSSESVAAYWRSDAPAPAGPATPLLTPDQLSKFMGPWITGSMLSKRNTVGAGDIYSDATPENISTSRLFELLRTAPSTVAGSWITSWEPPDSSNPNVIWESLWDHWGSKEHHELITTGQWDLTERFYDVGDTAAKLLSTAPVVGGIVAPESYIWKKRLGLAIGLPVLLLEPDPLSIGLAGLGKGLRPLAKGWRMGKLDILIEGLERQIGKAKTPLEKEQGLRKGFSFLETYVGGINREQVDSITKILHAQIGKELATDAANPIKGLIDDIEKRTKNLADKEAALLEMRRTAPEEVSRGEIEVLEAEQLVAAKKVEAATHLQTIAQENLRVAELIRGDAGAPPKGLSEYADGQEAHAAAQATMAELLQEGVGVGTATKGDVFKIEAAYQAQRRKLIKEAEEATQAEELRTGRVVTTFAAEKELRQELATLDKQIEVSTAAVRELTGRSLRDEVRESAQARLKEVEQELAELLTPEVIDAARLKKQGFTRPYDQKKWSMYLSQYPGNAPAKAIKKLKKEAEDLVQTLAESAEQAKQTPQFELDRELAEGTLLKANKRRTEVESKLLQEMQKRFKRTPTYIDEVVEAAPKGEVVATLEETIAALSPAQAKLISGRVAAKFSDEPGAWIGNAADLNKKRPRGAPKPQLQVKIEEGQIKIPIGNRYSDQPERWKILSRAELEAKGIKLPKVKPAPPKKRQPPEFKALSKSLTAELKDLTEQRTKDLLALQVDARDPAIKKLFVSAKDLDDITLAQYQLRRKAEAMLARERVKLAGQVSAEADAGLKSVSTRLNALGVKTLNTTQQKIVKAKHAIDAETILLKSRSGLWDRLAGDLVTGLKSERALLARGGKRIKADAFFKLVSSLPSELGGKVARLMGEGMKPTAALESVLPEIPRYVEYRGPGVNIRRVSEDPAVALARVETEAITPGVVEGSTQTVRPAQLKQILSDRYGKRVLQERLDFERLATGINGPPPGTGRPLYSLLESPDEALEITYREAIRFQEMEDALAQRASTRWKTGTKLGLMEARNNILAERGITGVASAIARFFRGGAVNSREMSDDLRRTLEVAENQGARLLEEVNGLVQLALREEMTEREVIEVFLRYMDGTPFKMGGPKAQMGETFMNSGVNLWDAPRVGLLNDTRWGGPEGQFMGNLGAEIQAKVLFNLEEEGITQLSIRADLLKAVGGKATPEFETAAALAWAKTVQKSFAEELALVVKKGDYFSPESAPKSIRSLATVWWPQGIDMPLTPARKAALLKSTYIALHSAQDFPSFMSLLREATSSQGAGVGTGYVDVPYRAYHNALLASGMAKIELEATQQAAKVVGLGVSPEAAKGMNALFTGEWQGTADGIEAFDDLLAVVNQLGLPINRVQVTEGLKGAAKKMRTIVRVGEDPSGMNAFFPTDLIGEFEEILGPIAKEIEAALHLTKTEKIAKALGPAQVPTEMVLNTLLNGVRLWRQSVVTGLIVPNPRHWTNTVVSNFFQFHQEEGLATAVKLTFQSIPVNIPFYGRTLQDATALKAAEGKLGTYTGAIFSKHLQEFWAMPTKIAAETYIRDAKGRLHNVLDLRLRAASDGILSTFEAERGLLKKADIAALAGKETRAAKAVRKVGDWNKAIAQMMVYGEQRTRTAYWLDRLITKGDTYEEARTATLNALYDWKHGISDFEREYLVHLMTFWRWFSLAARRHSSALTEGLTGEVTLTQALKGQTRLARIRKQLQFARSMDDIIDQEDKSQPNIKSETAEWDALIDDIRPWWSDERLIFGQRPMPLDHSLFLDDISGKTYTHYTYIGPAVTAAEMHTFFLTMTAGVGTLIALTSNTVQEMTGFEPTFVLPKGELSGSTSWAGLEMLFSPLIEMSLPFIQSATQKQLGGYRTSWTTRPVSLGEAILIDSTGGPEYWNLVGPDVQLDKNDRYRMNSSMLAIFRLLPFFGAQLPSILSNYYTAKPDMEESMVKGMLVMLGNFLSIRRVPTNPGDELKWNMVKMEKELKEELEAAKLPMERARYRDIWEK